MPTNTSVLEFIQGQLDMEVNSHDSLDSLGLESLELLDLQLECEKRFERHISPETYNSMHTVGDLANAFC